MLQDCYGTHPLLIVTALWATELQWRETFTSLRVPEVNLKLGQRCFVSPPTMKLHQSAIARGRRILSWSQDLMLVLWLFGMTVHCLSRSLPRGSLASAAFAWEEALVQFIPVLLGELQCPYVAAEIKLETKCVGACCVLRSVPCLSTPPINLEIIGFH